MKLYVYLIIICLLFIIGFYFLFRWRAKRQIQQYEQQKIKDATQYYDKINQEDKDRWLRNIQEVRDTYHNEHLKLEALNNEIIQKKEFNESMLQMREEELERIMDAKRTAADEAFAKEINDTTRQIQEWTLSAQEVANENQRGYRAQLQLQTEITEKELQQVQAYLEEYKEKQEAINKEILRRRAIEEKEDFYRIQLPETSKRDISYLLSIIDNFNNKEVIYKLIWSEYIQKPFKSMLNRVLENREPRNVIYMIQNLDTKEIYIGKTKAEVSKRWTEHIKSSLSIGTLSNAKIHQALFKNWDNFSFTILEEVSLNSNLNEKEKYYIDFYQSNIYGYNIKAGG